MNKPTKRPKKTVPKPTGRRYASVRDLLLHLTPDAVPAFDQYLIAQTAVRKLFSHEEEPLTHEEKQALLTMVPELRQFAEVSMS